MRREEGWGSDRASTCWTGLARLSHIYCARLYQMRGSWHTVRYLRALNSLDRHANAIYVAQCPDTTAPDPSPGDLSVPSRLGVRREPRAARLGCWLAAVEQRQEVLLALAFDFLVHLRLRRSRMARRHGRVGSTRHSLPHPFSVLLLCRLSFFHQAPSSVASQLEGHHIFQRFNKY